VATPGELFNFNSHKKDCAQATKSGAKHTSFYFLKKKKCHGKVVSTFAVPNGILNLRNIRHTAFKSWMKFMADAGYFSKNSRMMQKQNLLA
jgi:hypothetical protein